MVGVIMLSNATRFVASLFLGRGKYTNAEADTLDGVKALAEKMSAANPHIANGPMIVAVDAADNQARRNRSKPRLDEIREGQEARPSRRGAFSLRLAAPAEGRIAGS